MKKNNQESPELVNRFLNYSTTMKRQSEDTIKGYRNDLNLFFRFLFNKKINSANINIDIIDENFIKNIALTDLHSYIDYVSIERKNGINALIRKINVLISFYKYLVMIEVVNINIAQKLEMPKTEIRNPIYLSLEQSEHLLSVSELKTRNSERNYAIVTLFLNTGLRLSELTSIKLSQVNKNVIKIIGKGNKERLIFLNKACIEAINVYLQIRYDIDNEYLFLSEQRKEMDKSSIYNAVMKCLNEAGLGDYSPHKLRATAATLMSKNGVSVQKIAKILGHSRIETTMRYVGVEDEELMEAVNMNPLSNREYNS